MSGELVTHDQVEAAVRRLLSDARLVCEVDWPPDVLSAVQRTWAFKPHPPNKLPKTPEFVASYPAIGVLFLVQHGIRNYRENEFWTDLRLGPEQNRVGAAFEAALQTLGLETFPQFASPAEKARRFVAPILAHGGIPESLARDFLVGVLFPALRRGHGSTGTDLVARWRRDRPAGLTTTVARFLLHGGKTAIDLLDRLIALAVISREDLEAGTMTGVPPHLVRAFLAVPEAQVPSARAAIPRPSVELDPWSDEGPVMRLPPVAREVGEGLVWTIEDGSGIPKVERAYPRRDFTPLALFPADQWKVTATRGADVVFERIFECFGDGRVLCFDDSCRYRSDAEGLPAELVWIVAPQSVRLASVEAMGFRELAGETSTFFGAWAALRVSRIDLSTVEVLASLEEGKEIARVPVLHRASSRPEFVDGPMQDLYSQDGLDVRSALPVLAMPSRTTWNIRLTGPTGSFLQTQPAGDLPTTVELAALSGDASLGTWEVSVSGPLGSDLRDRFVLVPGLSVATPKAPIGPEVGDVSVGVSTSSRDVKFPGGAWAEDSTVVVPADQSRAELWVFTRRHAGKAGLFVSVPRIQWAFRADDSVPEFGVDQILFEPFELGAELGSLLVSAGRADIPVRVLLEDLEGDLLLLAGSRRSNADGQFKVDLGGLKDTATALASGGLQLVLHVGDTRAVIASHAAHRVPPDVPAQTLLIGRLVRTTVTAVLGFALLLDGDGWQGIVYADRLPLPLDEYSVGDEVKGTVVSIGERVKVDARVFDPTLFRVGEFVTAHVTGTRGGNLIATARGHEVVVPSERLPDDRPAHMWDNGDEVTGKVVKIDAERRFVRISAIPFDTTGLRVGDTIEGRVFFSGDVLLLKVGKLVGFVPSGELPGRPARTGETIQCRLAGIDDKKDQLNLSCRRFNPAGYAVGERVVGTISGISRLQAWVRLPRGDVALIELDHPKIARHAAMIGVGGRLSLVLVDIDTARNRIAAEIDSGG